MTGWNSRTAIEPSFCLKAALHTRAEMFRPSQGNFTLPEIVTPRPSPNAIINFFFRNNTVAFIKRMCVSKAKIWNTSHAPQVILDWHFVNIIILNKAILQSQETCGWLYFPIIMKRVRGNPVLSPDVTTSSRYFWNDIVAYTHEFRTLNRTCAEQ